MLARIVFAYTPYTYLPIPKKVSESRNVMEFKQIPTERFWRSHWA